MRALPFFKPWKYQVLPAAILSLFPYFGAGGEEKRVEEVIQEIVPELGNCFIASINAPCKPDTSAVQASPLRVFEDGRELGPPHSIHQNIRDVGRGAFSHWSGNPEGAPQNLYFSTSDNSDPRKNRRTYKWVIVYDDSGKPTPAEYGLLQGEPCSLQALPDAPLPRDRHTTLIADFNAPDTNDAQFARVQRAEIGLGNMPNAPGRFGGGVAVSGSNGAVLFPGLDNFNPLVGTVEFWAQARGDPPLWRDGKEHWLLIIYPERAGASSRYGMAPAFLALSKSSQNKLELSLATKSLAHYAAAVALRGSKERTLKLPVGDLSPGEWHHVLASWDLRGTGRLWLLVNGKGLTADINLPPDRPKPNPGQFVVFGGFWGLPGDNVLTSECNLDDLRVQDCPVVNRLTGAQPAPDRGIDQARLMQETDLARAMLDKLLQLQFRGGWSAAYNWPTYTPTGWSLVGRGVDMWFANSAQAGGALLRGHLLWGDDRYLDGAMECADMFCKTQLANGTWSYHYTYSRGEFIPWAKHAYIAQAMQSNQLRFLAMMYKLTGIQRYGDALRKAGDWMVSIQFPSGAWGWEVYPIGHKGPYGHPALNDAVTPQAMEDLFILWCATGEASYRHAALKGADWIIEAQAGPPTFGWADQYDEKNQFIWMRGFEPPAVSMQAISSATWGLCLAHDLTGDARYLQPLSQVLAWLDTVPQDQRGWLWYDPKTRVPVVAYSNEMLPVTHPKAIQEMIPRLDAHYGTKFPWQADRIRSELSKRTRGPVYPDWRGTRSCSEFPHAPTVEEFAAAFTADHSKDARTQLEAWAGGKPVSGILGGATEFGRTFEIGKAISYCERLLSDIECAQVALIDLPPERIPRYARGGSNNWVYLEPQRNFYEAHEMPTTRLQAAEAPEVPRSQAGNLYPFLRATAGHSDLELSFLHKRFKNVEAWKRKARAKVRDLLQYDPPRCKPRAQIIERVDCGSYIREKLTFNTTPDIRVPAYLLLPKDGKKRHPAIVALHDHGGFYVWGKEKVVATENQHPSLAEFKHTYYSDRSFADELGKRGYVVLAMDMFYWGERRMLLPGDPPAWNNPTQMSPEDVVAFNRRSSANTWLVGTGLFEAGITWAGVMFMDDIRAVDYLASRPEVDPKRIGCCGLSVGGFRSAHLAGLDPRIKAAVVVGWMSTYGHMLQSHLTSIGPMKVIPGLYKYMDLPDVVSMTVPGALLVIHGTKDALFPPDGVEASFDKIAKVYAKAGVSERFLGVTYDGPHEFNLEMQEKAFAWLDRWLK